jgi:hypothetical protein
MEVHHSVENVPIGDVASAPPSSSPKLKHIQILLNQHLKVFLFFNLLFPFLCFIDLPSVATKVIYLPLIVFCFCQIVMRQM